MLFWLRLLCVVIMITFNTVIVFVFGRCNAVSVLSDTILELLTIGSGGFRGSSEPVVSMCHDNILLLA